MDQKLFVGNWLSAFFTHFCSRFTNFQMRAELLGRHFLLTVFAKFGFLMAVLGMGTNFSGAKLPLTILTRDLFMELLLMLINIVDIIHLSTFIASLNIPPAIPKVSSNFRLRKLLKAIITFLHCLLRHTCSKYFEN